jgi:RNA recognition motif-containing protein
MFKYKCVRNLFKFNFYTRRFNKFSNKLTIKEKNFDDFYKDMKEPEDYRTIYIDNLPHDWLEDDIRVRLEQMGKLESLHIIKNSIGQRTGRIIAVYHNLNSLLDAIQNFRDKLPFFKPLKVRFLRETKAKLNISDNKPTDCLMIKNLPSDLPKEDLQLFLSEFKEPVHISYLRDEENEFKRIALVYFYTKEDAEHVLKFANLRYVKNKQMYIQYSYNHWDLKDFRTRAELKINLPPQVEQILFKKQIENFMNLLESQGEYSDKDKEKIEYLNSRVRKLEYQLKGPENVITIGESGDNKKKLFGNKQKKLEFEYSQDKSIIFADKKTLKK